MFLYHWIIPEKCGQKSNSQDIAPIALCTLSYLQPALPTKKG